MTISSDSAKELARLGVDLEISSDSGYSSDSVKDIIRIVVADGRRITVHAGKYSSDSLKEMARIGKEHICIRI